ncbi:formate/nitrite transporter family protein [Cohnella fermenti]|uniref:Formate/nitrite transporter family protein n=1 Tax=Cohnella fermenti TaxID=2565925 RepID=A0A4S4C0N1_9BACL|nr:formate/nitrite transporter family protein [Cohnella fermenti]THF81172.1 formate/nitrite transporter family protein [Cohnella fermenti]
MDASALEAVVAKAEAKRKSLQNSPVRYAVSSALAGAYVGMAVVLMFAVSAPLYAVHSPWTSLVMGASFGIALILVMFAGAELFTGNNMVYAAGMLAGRAKWKDAAGNWLWCWLGNFAGAAAFAWIVWRSGAFAGISAEHQLFVLAGKKMHLPFEQLFWRGVVCNWLVCLAVWLTYKLKSETAKMLAIAWCLCAFVAAGFEHSIANMTTLSLALLLPHPDTVTVAGLAHNLIPVTLGNIVGGALFVGAAYWFVEGKGARKAKEDEPVGGVRAALGGRAAGQREKTVLVGKAVDGVGRTTLGGRTIGQVGRGTLGGRTAGSERVTEVGLSQEVAAAEEKDIGDEAQAVLSQDARMSELQAGLQRDARMSELQEVAERGEAVRWMEETREKVDVKHEPQRG